MNDWISIGDRLPNENEFGKVMIHLSCNNQDNKIHIGNYNYSGFEINNIPVDLIVSHWMPLSRPPKY